MRYIVFTNTPAHVHLYRNAVTELESQGHDVLVLARDYGCTVELLEWFDLPFEVYGYCGTSQASLFRRLPGHYATILRRVRRFDPDLVFGMGAYAAHAGAVSRTPTVLLVDSEPTSLDHIVSRPFADAILTPATFRKDLGAKHYVFDGFKEIAYLHPDVFTADTTVRAELGVGDDRFAIVRFNAFGSHHDLARGGFSTAQRRQLVEHLAESATVVVSDEGGDLDLDTLPARPYDLHPARLHHALAEASLLVADTQTMVTEAALLATPAVRSNSFVGESDMGNFLELEDRELIYNESEFDAVLDRTTDLLTTDEVGAVWECRRDAYIAGKVNLTEVIVDVASDPGALDQIEGLTKRSERGSDDAHPGTVEVRS